jgi:hypothetical protein
MRTSIVVATLAVLGLAAAGGYYGLEVFPEQQFRAGLDQALATLPRNTTVTYKTAHYSVLSHHAVVTGMTVHGEIPGNPPQPFDVTAATIETENPNLDFPGAWAHAMAAPAAFGPDTPLLVANSSTVTGMTVHSAAINMTEDSIRVTNLRLYPWALLHDGMPSWTDLQTALMPKPGPPDAGDLRTILRAEAAAAEGIAYDGYEAGPAKVTEALPGIDIQYNIRKMNGDTFDRGTIAGGTGEGITFSSSKVGAVSIDRVAIGPIDIREPMTRLVNGQVLSAALLDGIKIGRIEYSGITAQPPGQAATHIGSFSMGPVAFTRGMPVSGKLGWTDLMVSKTQLSDPRVLDVFDKLGLETMTMSFAFAYDWDVAQQRASVHDTMLKVNELGTITVSADLTNVIASTADLSRMRLAHARLRFDDASLVDRVLRAGAAQTGTDPAVYRQQIVDMVREQSDAQGVASPAMTAARQAAADFIASPHSLTIELSPAQPVAVMTLKNANMPPAMLATMLGLSVSTNQ